MFIVVNFLLVGVLNIFIVFREIIIYLFGDKGL